MSGLTILYRMTGNSQNFARIKLGIKLISDSVISLAYLQLLILLKPFYITFFIFKAFQKKNFENRSCNLKIGKSLNLGKLD